MSPDSAPTPTLTLEFLVEPALVVRRDGTIILANAAWRRRFPDRPVGSSLYGVSHDPRSELDALLRRARASTAPSIGALTFDTSTGSERMRVHAARFSTGEVDGVVLRLIPAEADQFAILNSKVRELDHQLRQRLHEKAALEEALRLNRTLVDELQHRVKNNIQMMMVLIRMSAQGHKSGDVAAVVEKATLRLQAMASTQEAVYRSTKHGTVRSEAFLSDLVASIGESLGFSDEIEAEIADVELDSSSAHCLALIVNELVTNAGKHALRGARDRSVRVVLAESEEDMELTVADNGPGMPEDTCRRHSGLHLVRSLCRQIGGSLDIAGKEGTTCRVRFGKPKESRP